MKTNWKVGDWCFSEFELKQIKDIRERSDGVAITQLSDGFFGHSGYFLNGVCYPMDLKVKMISEHYKRCEDKLQAINDEDIIPKGSFSNIYRLLVNKWCNCCDDKDDNEKLQKHYSDLENWYILLTEGNQKLRKYKLEQIKNV